MTQLNERRMNPDLLKLNISQKRVLKKAAESGDPKLAAEAVAASSDSRNLESAVKVLVKYGLITTYPPVLGPNVEPDTIELTDLGQEYADEYNVTDDPALITPDEKEESEPVGGVADTGTGAEEMGMNPLGNAGGQEEMGLELASFFQEINQWATFLKERK